MDIARKSALETYNWLLFFEESLDLKKRMKNLKQENFEIIKILSSIIINSRKSDNRL